MDDPFSMLDDDFERDNRVYKRPRVSEPVRHTNAALAASVPDDNPVVPEGEPVPQWEPTAYCEYDWSNVEEQEDSDDWPDFCFLCHCTQIDDEILENPRYHKLLDLIEENYIHMDPRRMAKMVQDEYNREIRAHNEQYPVWRQQMILEHVEKHAPTPRVMAEDALRTVNNAVRVLRDCGMFVKEVGGSRVALDPKNTIMYLRLLKERSSLVRQVQSMRGGGTSVL